MRRVMLFCVLLVAVFWVVGCTFHFKGKEIEIDSERQRVRVNETYELIAMGLFDGRDSKPITASP